MKSHLSQSYLSQIVSRSAEESEAGLIKPIIKTWPVINSTDNSVNPFDGEIDLLDVVAPAYSICPKTSFEIINPPEAGQILQSVFSPNTLSGRQKPSPMIITKPSAMFPIQKKTVQHPPIDETLASSASPEKDDKPSKTKKTILSKKNLVIKKQDTKKSEKSEKNISNSENIEQVKPVYLEPKTTHNRSEASDLQNDASKKEQKAQIQYKPELEPLRQSSFPTKMIKLAPSGSKNNKKLGGMNEQPIPELQPMTPQNTHLLPLRRKNDADHRLVIGRLKVEVVPPLPIVRQRPAVRTIIRTVKPQSESDRNSFSCKLRFGLGQM